jgi:hypothetical protein
VFLDDRAVSLLNKHARPARFSTATVLSEIEEVLMAQWRRLVGEEGIRFNNDIQGPSDVFKYGNWDLVFWAGGRRSLDDSDREVLGCSSKLGETEDVIVFEMRGFSPPNGGKVSLEDLENLAAVDLTGRAQQAGLSYARDGEGVTCPRQVVIRCAPDYEANRAKSSTPVAWLWLLGLPPELLTAKMSSSSSASVKHGEQHASLGESLEAELQALGVAPSSSPREADDSPSSSTAASNSASTSTSAAPPWMLQLKAAANAMQEQLFNPTSVSLRWVDASYWSSDRCVCPMPGHPSGRLTPLILIGDAAMGKPFHLGTTLDIHLNEVKTLSKYPAMVWGIGNQEPSSAQKIAATALGKSLDPLENESSLLAIFRPVEDQYQDVLKRSPGFCR